MRKKIIEFHRVGLAYERTAPLFEEVTFDLERGDFYFLTGASGTGKTTLLRLLYFGLAPTSGDLFLFGQEASSMTFEEKNLIREKMGIVFQDFKLLNHLNVLENVALPLRIRGLDEQKSHAQARELLHWVGVESIQRPPASLSGGEQQRVSIARAVIARPQLLLADEPTGNIDDETAEKVIYLFEQLHGMGTSILFATHNQRWLERTSHPVLEIDKKRLRVGSPRAEAAL